MNNEIRNALDALKEDIATDSRIQAYHTLKALVETDEVLFGYIQAQKKIQKELVQAKAFEMSNLIVQLQGELQQIETQIASYPLMVEYEEAARAVAELVKEIEGVLFE